MSENTVVFLCHITRIRRTGVGMNTRVKTKENVAAVITSNKSTILKYGVRRLGLFGSFMREDQSLHSDVDILVEFALEEKTYDNFIQLSFLLEDSLGRNVELAAREALSPHIAPHILNEVEYVL